MEAEKSRGPPDVLSGPKRHFTPLYGVGILVLLIEGILAIGISRVTVSAQNALIGLTATILILVVIGLFLILAFRPENFYSPSEYGHPTGPKDYIEALRSRPSLEREQAAQQDVIAPKSEGQANSAPASADDTEQQPPILTERHAGRDPVGGAWIPVFLTSADFSTSVLRPFHRSR